jgi:hypothetical protein
MAVPDPLANTMTSSQAEMSKNYRTWIALGLFVLSLSVYLHNHRYRFWAAGGDTTPAELLPLALERNHSLHFDGFEGKGTWWFHRVKGHAVSAYPILPGFFNIPAYALARWQGIPLDSPHRSMLSMISASVVTSMSVPFFFLALSRIVAHRFTAICGSLLYAFGTTAFSVAARGMWQHGPSLLFLTIALWLITREDTLPIALAGLPLGFAVFNRPVNMLIVVPLAAVILWRFRRAILPFCAAAAVPAALMVWYSIYYWGSVTTFGQYPSGDLFTGRMGPGIAGLLVSPSRGLFVFTPLFLFSAVMLVVVLRHPRRDPLLTAMAASILMTLLLYSKWYSWWGGSCFGYRLLTELTPFLVILLAVGWERFFAARRLLRPLLIVAAALSLYFHLLGAFYYPSGFETVPNEINAHPERLWSWTDGEIARCSQKFVRRIEWHLNRP